MEKGHVNTKVVTFPINGQGVFIYTVRDKERFSIYVTPKHIKKYNTTEWITTFETDENMFGELHCASCQGEFYPVRHEI